MKEKTKVFFLKERERKKEENITNEKKEEFDVFFWFHLNLKNSFLFFIQNIIGFLFRNFLFV